MKATVRLECSPPQTPRALQVAGMFDVPLDAKLTHHIDADLPIEDKPWSIGLVTGPSGAGKSSLAKELWPDALLGAQEWGTDTALVDGFPAGMGIREVTGLLSAVGLASVPAWCKPFGVLSNGEQFRASIARAMAETSGLVVVDEYSSTVDRQVAKVASHALQKAVRRTERQLVAVTCHYDVTDWLQPDWTYDVATGDFQWRCLQPHPPIKLDIYPCDRSLWPAFKNHHYLARLCLRPSRFVVRQA